MTPSVSFRCLHLRPELIAALRIETQRRLVEKQDLRRVQKAAGDLEPPLHPAGELLHRRPCDPTSSKSLSSISVRSRRSLRGTW